MNILIRILIGLAVTAIAEISYLIATGKIKVGILLDMRNSKKDDSNSSNSSNSSNKRIKKL